jgi:hypothetical protein
MAQFYSGIINLSKIPKELIRENRAGEKIIYVDFAERRTPSAYGDTHYIKLYDAANRQTHYIGDFRPREIGGSAPAPSPAPSPVPNYTPMSGADDDDQLAPQVGDLPF